MKHKSIILFAVALFMGASASLLSSCGKKTGDNATSDHPAVADADLDPVDFEHGANAITVEQLDEKINIPDDLTPGQATGALIMLNDRNRDLRGTKRDVNMRKFVDLYGIMIDIHGDNMRKALRRVKDRMGVDLENIYAEYTNSLRVGDEAGASNPDEVQATISTVNDDSTTVSDNPTLSEQPVIAE